MPWLDRLRRRPDAERIMAEALAAAQAQDYDTALALWEPLARAGHARAQNNIGACFAEGRGVAQDKTLALKWLALSAEAGDAVGRRNLAALHMQGLDGGNPDHALAAKYYRLAAEQGDGPAQDMLSWMLLEGDVLPPDPVEARLWAEKAAEAGIASAMTRLGMIHHNALGVPRDPEQAVRWWKKGTDAGDADAMAMLGAALHLGAGVPRDDAEALLHLLRAEREGSLLAKPFLPRVRENLTPGEVAKIEDLARREGAP